MRGIDSRDGFSTRAGAVLALVAIAALRMPFLTAGPDAQLSLMVDDASYYLEASRRAVEGAIWPTMDGRNPTNGFHPLYMCALAAVQFLIGTDPRTVMPFVMALNLALNGLAVWILIRAVKRGGGGIGILAALAMALNAGWLAHGLAGVENSLSAIFVLIAALRWHRRFGRVEGHERTELRGWIGDGVLLGIVALARTDGVLLVIAYLGAAMLVCARSTGLRKAFSGTAVAAAAFLATLSPCVLISVARFGSVLQDSAGALAARFASEVGMPGSARWMHHVCIDLGFWAYRLAGAWGCLPLTGWLLGLSLPGSWGSRRASRPWLAWVLLLLCAFALFLRSNDPTDIRDARMAGVELGFAGLAFLGGALSLSSDERSRRPVFGMLLAYAALTVTVFSFFFHGFQYWYATGPCLAAILLVTAPALDRLLRGRRALGIALVLLVAIHGALSVRGYLARGGREGMDRNRFAEGASLRRDLEKVAERGRPFRLGAFDSGELSYVVHPFPVTNLDGVMNHRASLAIRRGRLSDYLREDRITHIFGDSARIAEFQAVSPFEATLDSARSREMGAGIWRVGTGASVP